MEMRGYDKIRQVNYILCNIKADTGVARSVKPLSKVELEIAHTLLRWT